MSEESVRGHCTFHGEPCFIVPETDWDALRAKIQQQALDSLALDGQAMELKAELEAWKALANSREQELILLRNML